MGRKIPKPPPSSAASVGAGDITPATFAFSATRIATAQIIKSIGFSSAKRSALETLSLIAGKHLSSLAASAAASAVSGGRTEPNLHDVVTSLEENASASGGFRGASDLDRRILASSTLTDLSEFVNCSLEIPFAQALRCCCRRLPAGGVSGRVPDGVGHVPGWLPAFPVVEREREVVVREGEKKLFGCLVSEETRKKDDDTVFVDERMSIGLPKKRERVRFEIRVMREGGFGVGSRNGVCRGGKRIFCAKSSINHDDENMIGKGNRSLNGKFGKPLQYYRRRNRL